MKRIFLLFVLLSQISFSQKVNFDFVINIDKQTVEKVYDVLIKFEEMEITAEYYPGCLLIDKDALEKIKTTKNCKLKFKALNIDRSSNMIEYEFEIDGNWFYSKYLVLDVFDMSDRQSKKKFKPLVYKNYTFSLGNGNRYIIPMSR